MASAGVQVYSVKAFQGIDQSQTENRLDIGASPDARNMDTENGDLAVARGFVKHITSEVPTTATIRRMYIWRDLVTVRYVVIAGYEVFAYVDTDATPAWKVIHTYTPEATGGYPVFTGLRWDFIEARIGDTDYLLIANGERQMLKWDGKTATAVLFGSATNLSDIAVNFIEMHYSRLFSAGDRNFPSRLYWSKLPGDTRSIEDWRADDASAEVSGGHVEVGDTSTDPITGLCALSNQLLIFKRSSIYRLLGDRPGNYRVYRVYSEVEQMVNSSVVIYGDTPFWMTRAGMYFHDGQNSRPMYNARQIRTFLKDARLSACKAAENRDRLYFTCRTGDSSGELDNAVVVYDTIEKTYMIRDGFEVADICAANGTIYMMNNAGIIYRFDEGETYDGAPIHAYWQTPLTDLDNLPGIKTIGELYLRGEGANEIVQIEVLVGNNTKTYRCRIPQSVRDVLEIPTMNEGRVFSFQLKNEEGSRWRILGGLQVQFSQRQRTI